MLENGAIKKFLENFNFSEYDKKCNNCSNVFYLMNLREDTHSKLLTWLFDFNNKKEDSIQYNFSREFFKNFLPNINMENGTNINIKSQKIVEEGRPDIVLEIGNNLIVIEVKLDARTSIIEYENKRRTQYERYQIWAEKKYPKFEKKYLLIYTTDERLKTEKDFYIGKKHIDEMNGNDIANQLGYVSIQFSDIVLILYKILKQDYGNKKPNTNQYEETLELIEILIKYVENEDNKTKIETLKEYLEKNKSITKQNIEDKKLELPQKCNISLDKIMENLEDKELLLIQFIDYWQYNDKIIGSYTEIVEIENKPNYLYEVIYDNIFLKKSNLANFNKNQEYIKKFVKDMEKQKRKYIIKIIKDYLNKNEYKVEKNRCIYKVVFFNNGEKYIFDNTKTKNNSEIKLFKSGQEIASIEENEYNEIFYKKNDETKKLLIKKIEEKMKN